MEFESRACCWRTRGLTKEREPSGISSQDKRSEAALAVVDAYFGISRNMMTIIYNALSPTFG